MSTPPTAPDTSTRSLQHPPPANMSLIMGLGLLVVVAAALLLL